MKRRNCGNKHPHADHEWTVTGIFVAKRKSSKGTGPGFGSVVHWCPGIKHEVAA